MNWNLGQDKIKNRKRKFLILTFFFTLLTVLIMANFIAFRSYQEMGILTIVPLDSLFFLIMGIVLLGIACFSALQLHQYRIGKLFSIYVLLIGLSIILAPCNQLNEEVLSFIRSVFTLGSSVLLFQVVGYLTLLINRKLFKVLLAIIVFIAVISMVAQIFVLFPIENIWIYILAAESINGCIVLSALFSLAVMAINYKGSNAYARKQSKILIWGIGAGVLLFFVASVFPNIYLVQSGQEETETFMEISILPTETVIASFPLLLFAGISVAIIFMMLHREFSLEDMRLKVSRFIIISLYLGLINILLFLYANTQIWILIIINILILVPLLLGVWRFFSYEKNAEEQSYEWRLITEVDKEKQELSAYLHDEVLQSLIAFYRKVQSDESGRYDDMKIPLSDLISQIRNVSHNLYPTMVEDLGLEQSLFIFVEDIQRNYPEIKINYKYKFTEGILQKTYALVIYRISKELVTNAAKHSGGYQVDLSLDEDENGYYIRVQDDGNGFHVQGNDKLLKSPHMGLYTIRKQIAGLQGQIDMQSALNKGTRYDIYIPKQEGLEIET